MHELSLCQALIRQVKSLAAKHDAQRVVSIVVRVGPLSGVVPELLEHAYRIASADTIADTASLVVEPSPVRVVCTECAVESEVACNKLLCGGCGGWRTRVVSGDEIVLASLEIETGSERNETMQV